MFSYFRKRREKKDLELIAKITSISNGQFLTAQRALKDTMRTSVDEYLATHEHLIINYLIVSLRGEYLYYLAQKMADPDNTPQLGFYYDNEKKMVTERFRKLFPLKTENAVNELVNTFYAKK